MSPATAQAIPVFAHRYSLSCQACHSTVPHLNSFGEQFLAAGYQLPSAAARVFPIAVKVNLTYASAPDLPGLPKAIVDEVELLTGGHAGRRVSYFAESYVIDGGRPGNVRDLWARYDFSTNRAALDAGLRLGQFTLPLPVDPETFRETLNHYAIFDQTVGQNPFRFFDQHLGAALELASNRTALRLVALRGHDPHSGLPTLGTDAMASVHRNFGSLGMSVYRYEGSRPLGPQPDFFWRQGYSLQVPFGRATLTNVLQNGNDTSVDGLGADWRSSGGFSELRWSFSPAITGVLRYDATSDPHGAARSTTFAIVRRLRSNSKLTLESVWQRNVPSLNAGLLFAY
jgi:hypothetical protein